MRNTMAFGLDGIDTRRIVQLRRKIIGIERKDAFRQVAEPGVIKCKPLVGNLDACCERLSEGRSTT